MNFGFHVAEKEKRQSSTHDEESDRYPHCPCETETPNGNTLKAKVNWENCVLNYGPKRKIKPLKHRC